MGDADVRVVCGPTAAGKSAIGLWLAAGHRATIISADSRATYRGFDVGTAKPTLEERTRVPHLGLDVVDPTERWSAAAWADAADRWIGELRTSGREPLVVGGTGFYLRALFDPLFEEPPLDEARRLTMQAELDRLDTPTLRRWVEALDPPRSRLGRTQLLRAIEVALLTGQRLSDLHARRARPPRRTARYLLVDPGPALATRIAARVTAMLDGGWIEEVRALAASVPLDAPAWNATGYRTVLLFAEGGIERAEAERRIVIETRQYAKRQRTWFRHQLPPDRVTHLDPTRDDWRARAEAWWSGDAMNGRSDER